MLIDTTTNQNVEFYLRPVNRDEIIENHYNPDGGWAFDWLHPLSHGFEIYGLVTDTFPESVQGLIALKQNPDEAFNCVDIDIVESSPNNKKEIGGNPNIRRTYKGVGRCLIAFACQYSIDNGFEGYVGLTSKSSKFKFYEDMGAFRTSGQRYMFFDTTAKQLVQIYFPGGVKWWKKQK